MKRVFLITFFIINLQFLTCHKFREVRTIYEWKLLEYGFPTESDRQQAIADGNLVPENSIPIDVDVEYKGKDRRRVFTTIPRFDTGISYTLATVSNKTGPAGPVLEAYPDYSWHDSHGSNCDDITSAFRVAINECNQMWVIDSGVIGSDQHCPPQLLLFDLRTDKLIHRYRFPNNTYVPAASLFITPVISVSDPPPRGNCSKTMVYVADCNYHGLVVYNYEENTSWRVVNRYMYPNSDYGLCTVAGQSFILMDGIFGMSTDKKNLYFHPLASADEYTISTRFLNNQTIWEENEEALPNEFIKLGTRGTQCAAEAIDSENNIYCVTFNPIKLISWNVNTPYKFKNLREIPANPRLLEFVSGMKVRRNDEGKEELWLLSNRFQKFATGTLNPNDTNFRILRRQLDDLNYGFNYGSYNENGNLHNQLIFQ